MKAEIDKYEVEALDGLKGFAFLLDAVSEASKDGKHIYEEAGMRILSNLYMELLNNAEYKLIEKEV